MKRNLLITVIALIALLLGALYQRSTAYDFATLDGSTYQFESLQGQWVIVNYFAEWCAPCLREVPELNAFNQAIESSQTAKLFAVSYDAKQDHELQLLVDKYDMQFAIVNEVKTAFPFETPKYLPATYLIRPDGTLAGQLLGEQTKQGLLQAIAAE